MRTMRRALALQKKTPGKAGAFRVGISAAL
jgi:hypothetical protein